MAIDALSRLRPRLITLRGEVPLGAGIERIDLRIVAMAGASTAFVAAHFDQLY